MPVPSQESRLLSLITTKGSGVYQRIQDYLDQGHPLPDQIPPHAWKQLCYLLKQALMQPGDESMKADKAWVILSLLQQLGTELDAPTLELACNSGLTVMINCLSFVSECLYGKSSDTAEHFLEDLFDLITNIADRNAAVKEILLANFAIKMFQMILLQKYLFSIRLETLKGLNLLLDRCSLKARTALTSQEQVQELMKKAAFLVTAVGDYEFQVGLTEALFRLTQKDTRIKCAKKWFKNDIIVHSFANVRDAEFETDCRMFLNVLNGMPGEETMVLSYPCVRAFLADYKLLKPNDENYTDFWVDFNLGSKRITLFCNQDDSGSQFDESLWETVAIWQENVKTCTVKCDGDLVKVQLELTCNAKELISFGNIDGNIVSIEFDAKFPVEAALVKLYGQDRVTGNQDQVAVRRASVPTTPMSAQSLDDSSKKGGVMQNTFPESSMMSSQDGSQNSAPRLKISIPVLPMTPRQVLEGSSVNNMDGGDTRTPRTTQKKTGHEEKDITTATTPKTPTSQNKGKGKTPKRVKTPLVILTREEVESAASTSRKRDTPKTSGQNSTKNNPAKLSMPDTAAHKPDDAAFEQNGEMSPELPQVAEPLNSSKLSDKSQIRHSARQSAKKDTRSTRKKRKNNTDIDDTEGFMIPSSVPDEPIVVPDSQPFDTVLHEIHESIKHFDAGEQKIQEDKDGQEQTVHSTTSYNADASPQSKKSQTKQTEDADLPEGEKTRYRISHSPALSTVTEESSVTSSQDAKMLPKQNKTTPLQPIEEETYIKNSKGKNSGNRESQAKGKPSFSISTRQLRSRKKDTEPIERGAHDSSVEELLPAQKQPKSKQRKQVKDKQTKQKDVPNRDSQEDPFGFTETPVQDSVPTTMSQESNSLIPDTGTCEASNAPKVQPKFFKSRARRSDSSQVGGSKKSLYDYESHLAAVQNRKPARTKAKKGKGPQQKPRSKCELSPAENDFHTAVTNTSGRIITESEKRDSPPNISSYELSVTHREAELGTSRIVSQTCASSPSVYDEEEFEDIDSPAQPEKQQLQEKTHNKKQQTPRSSTEIVLETNISESLVSKATEQTDHDQTDRERKQTPKGSAAVSGKKHEPKSRRKSTHVDKEKEDKVANSLTASVKSQKKQRKKEEADDRNADISTSNLEDSVSHFTNVCKKLLRKTKKPAVYKDISRSDIDMDTSTDISVTVTSTKKRQPLKPIQNEMNNITPAPTKTRPRKASKESKKKKSVFSETEDATDSRSEISWLVSTAKRREKEKAKPKKTYTQKGKFTLYKPSMLGSHEDDVNISSLFNDDDVTVPESKSMPPKKRKQLYESVEEPLSDHHDDISYKPDSKKKKQAQQKRKQSHESVKEPSSEHNEDLSYRPDQKKKRPSKSPGQTSSNHKRTAKSPKEPPASRESFVDKLMSRLDVKTAHTPITPSVSVKTPKSTGLQSIPDDLSIEELRIEDAWSQPTPALQLDLSPMVLDEVYQQKKHTPGSSRKKCQSDKLSKLSKEFSPLPSVTPKSHKISSQDITRNKASSAESGDEEEDQVHQAPDQQNDNDLLRSGHANRSKNRKPNPHRVKPFSSDSESEEMDLSQSSFLQPRRLFETGSPVAVKLASSLSSSESKQEEEEVEIEDIESKHYHHMSDSSAVQTGITSLLKSFSSELQRSVLAKRQKLEMFTKGTAKATQRQINDMWTKQNTVRQNILDDFQGLLVCEMRELEKEVNHMKEAEDKTLAFFQEQHKVMQACRSSQEQRIRRLCRIQENFISEIEETEDQHTQQQATMRDILRREMHSLQKKILFSSQQNEIRNVKKALQSLIL